MPEAIKNPIALYGTDEPAPPPVILRAGALTAELDAGNLRHIRFGGVEVIRAVSFLVRDKNWGTYSPTIDALKIDQGSDGVTVTYRAEVKDERQSFAYTATITGTERQVSFAAEGAAAQQFETCRTGFVVLHPVDGVVGAPVTIEHTDGRVEQGRFPDLIDPIQPMLDLRALTHEATPGVTVRCLMEGDAFEMEDQRNWCDASYKTYVRPLSRPWPFHLAAGEPVKQAVSLTIEGAAPQADAAGGVIEVEVGEAMGTAPALGLGFDPAEVEATRRVLPKLKELRPRMLVGLHDPRQGHDRAALEAVVEIAQALGAEPWLEVVVADVDDFAAEIAALGALVKNMGSPFKSILLSPAPDLKSTAPGQTWPKAPDQAAFHRAARKAFPGVRLGGGMISTFTELNRKRPPLDDLDYVGFTTVALIHASDDISVIEGLEALPSIARSAKAIAKHLPVVVGPSAIGLRQNPYGVTPLPNPDNKRQPMQGNDPRQRGQLGAAWAVGYYARVAPVGVEAIVIGGTTGPFGAVHTPRSWPTPGYDREGVPYPIFDALRAISDLQGATLRRVSVSASALIDAVAAQRDGTIHLIVSNRTVEPRQVTVAGRTLTLGPYGVARQSLA